MRTSLKDRQEDEKKGEKKVEKLEKEVRDFTTVTPPLQRQDWNPGGVTVNVGTPATPVGDDHQQRGETPEEHQIRKIQEIRNAVGLKKTRQYEKMGRVFAGWTAEVAKGQAEQELRQEVIRSRHTRGGSPARHRPGRASPASTPQAGNRAVDAAVHLRDEAAQSPEVAVGAARAQMRQHTPSTAAMMTGAGGADSPYTHKTRGLGTKSAQALSPQLQEALDRDPGRTPRGS